MPKPRLTFFVELSSDELVLLLNRDDVLGFLQRGGHRVALGMLDLSDARAACIRRLTDRGVGVTAWLLLDREDGYWLNADNYALALERYRALHAWIARQDLKVDWLGLDIEPPRDQLDGLVQQGWGGVVRRLSLRRDATAVEIAEKAYRALCEQAHHDGYLVESYQWPFIVDERRSGSTLLRRALGIVDVPVDREVLMLYRSYLAAEGTRAYFDDADAIALGVTGGGVHAHDDHLEPKLDWPALRADLLSASRAGKPLYVFSLEGCAAQGMLAEIEQLDWQSAPEEPTTGALGRAQRGRRFMQMAARGEPLLDRLFPTRP